MPQQIRPDGQEALLDRVSGGFGVASGEGGSGVAVGEGGSGFFS